MREQPAVFFAPQDRLRRARSRHRPHAGEGPRAFVQLGFTNSRGHYTIGGLFAGTYAVCVSGGDASGGGSNTGYLGRCLGNKSFNGSTVPSGATKVSLNNGQAVSLSHPQGYRPQCFNQTAWNGT